MAVLKELDASKDPFRQIIPDRTWVFIPNLQFPRRCTYEELSQIDKFRPSRRSQDG